MQLGPLRVGLVGLDSMYWPIALAEALAQAGAATKLTTVCDLGCRPGEVKGQLGMGADELADRWGARLSHSVEEAADAADACFVSTRHSQMPAVASRLLALGKPVFVAKPVATSSASMAALLSARLASGLPCAAGMTARSSAIVRAASRLVADGTIGEVLSVRVAHQHGRLSDWPPSWYSDPSEGDPFLWLGWYAIDGVLALTGSNIASISGASREHLAAAGTPDLLRGIAELSDGRIATLEIHFTVGDWGLGPVEIEVVGTEGVLRSSGVTDSITLLAGGGPRVLPLDRVANALADEIAAWVRAIQHRGTPLLTLEQAAHLVAVSEAWRLSARDRRWVSVAPEM